MSKAHMRERERRREDDLRHEQARALLAYQLLGVARDPSKSLGDNFSWSLVLAKPTVSRHVTSMSDVHPDIVLEAAACPRCAPMDAFMIALVMLDLAFIQEAVTPDAPGAPHYARRVKLLHDVVNAAASVIDITCASTNDLRRYARLMGDDAPNAERVRALLVAREISE